MNGPDLEELPPVFSVLVASKVLGIGKNQTYDLIRREMYPVRILKINGRFRVSPRCRCGRRRTGVKMAGGTARDVVVSLVRSRPRVSLTPGAGFPEGPFIVASSTRVSFFRSPPVPRAVSARRLAVQIR